jgi:hypothetical protein
MLSEASRSRLPRARRCPLLVEPLERRELLATIQNFNAPGTGTPYTTQQFGAAPGPAVVATGVPGNSLMQLTNGTAPVPGQINQVAFDLSNPGTYNQVSATFDFQITPGPAGGRGNGLSFALLNTANYGTTGPASSLLAEKGFFNGSLGIGFDTFQAAGDVSDNFVVISFGATRLNEVPIDPALLDLASGIVIAASISVDFTTSEVSVSLTPAGGSVDNVVTNFPVAGLAPYQSRLAFTASTVSSQATMNLDNVNGQFIGLRQTGSISFSSSIYFVAENDPSGVATIDVVRAGGTAGSVVVNFVSADGTAKNGVNYTSIASVLTFQEGQTDIPVQIPIIDDHVADGNKTVLLFIGNPTLTATLVPPIQATLTILDTDAPPPTVSPKVQLVYAAHTRRVIAFQLTFSQSMDATRAQNVANYQVILPPAHKNGPRRSIPLSRAVLDPTGSLVTLYRADLDRQHLTKFVQILVRGTPPTGLLSAKGSYLAGTNGQGGTDALLLVSI